MLVSKDVLRTFGAKIAACGIAALGLVFAYNLMITNGFMKVGEGNEPFWFLLSHALPPVLIVIGFLVDTVEREILGKKITASKQ